MSSHNVIFHNWHIEGKDDFFFSDCGEKINRGSTLVIDVYMYNTIRLTISKMLYGSSLELICLE